LFYKLKIRNNYTKNSESFKSRILSKVTALTYRVKSLTENNNNNYLKSYGIRTGTTSWSINGQHHARIDFKVKHTENGSFITFDYKMQWRTNKL
jgi:hypothetical protein